MKIGFLLMAHKQPDQTLTLARQLLADGDRVVIHWDSKSTFDFASYARSTLQDTELERVAFAERVKVHWGEWSMVQATLNGLQCLADFPDIDYVYLLSGSDILVKPLSQLKEHIKLHAGANFIECVNPREKKWVTRGLNEERYIHYHFFNWQDNPRLFSLTHKIQKLLRIQRKTPQGLDIYFGSQWWCLTYPLAMNILKASANANLINFFKYTSVPDEMYFQTMAACFENPHNFLPLLTYYKFDSTGKPHIFYDDHYDFIKKLPHFFVRKVADQAQKIRTITQDNKATLCQNNTPMTRAAFYVPECSESHVNYFGDLIFNKNSYFIIFSYDSKLLHEFYLRCHQTENTCIFYDLFNKNKIDYGKFTAQHPSYGEDDVKRRDIAPMTFINDLLTFFSANTLIFLFHPENFDLYKRVFWDKNVFRCFLIQNNIHDNLELSISRKTITCKLRTVTQKLPSLVPTTFKNMGLLFASIEECIGHSFPFVLLDEKIEHTSLLRSIGNPPRKK